MPILRYRLAVVRHGLRQRQQRWVRLSLWDWQRIPAADTVADARRPSDRVAGGVAGDRQDERVPGHRHQAAVLGGVLRQSHHAGKSTLKRIQSIIFEVVVRKNSAA